MSFHRSLAAGGRCSATASPAPCNRPCRRSPAFSCRAERASSRLGRASSATASPGAVAPGRAGSRRQPAWRRKHTGCAARGNWGMTQSAAGGVRLPGAALLCAHQMGAQHRRNPK